MERMETAAPHALRDTADRLRRTTEQCMAAQERIRRRWTIGYPPERHRHYR